MASSQLVPAVFTWMWPLVTRPTVENTANLSEPERRDSVMKALEQLLYVPFEFENAGTRVIFYDPESYELPDK